MSRSVVDWTAYVGGSKMPCCQLSVILGVIATVNVHLLSAEERGDSSVQRGDNVRIAVVQQETVPGAVAENRARALQFAKQAIGGKADIILFHEALTVGYVPNIHKLAEPADGSTTKAFQKLLDEENSDAMILYGLIERDGESFFTSAILVNRQGVVTKYRKTHLWWAADGVRHEPTFFQAGNRLVTFDLKGHKAGIMICYDGDFPEMTRAYAMRGCAMLFWLNNRGSRGHREVQPLARANSMIMATSCVCGKNESGQKCRGGSNITDRDGSLLKEIWDNQGIIYADVVPGTVLKDREKNPWFRGQRQDLYR